MATEGPQRLANALLNPISNGTYPESEDVITAQLGSADLTTTLDLVRQSQKELQGRLRQAGLGASGDVDAWITQARQLQADIESSRREARDIVRKHEAGKAVAAKVEDASAKVRFLHSETEYNQAVLSTLGEIRDAVKQVSTATVLVDSGDLKFATIKVADLEGSLREKAASRSNERAWSLILGQAQALRSRVLDGLHSAFDRLVHVQEGRLNIKHTAEPNQDQMDLGTILSALEQLGALDETLTRTSKRIQRHFFQPLLSRTKPAQVIDSAAEGLQLQSSNSEDLSKVLHGFRTTISYVQKELSAEQGRSVLSRCLQHSVPLLISDWLTPAIPASLEDLNSFKHKQAEIEETAAFVSSNGYKEGADITDWLTRVPRNWVAKRRVTALDGVRSSFLSYRGKTRTVERVERETVSKSGDPLNDAGLDDWDAGWSEDAKERGPDNTSKPEDDDVSGWDFDGDENTAQTQQQPSGKDNADEDPSDAWGWDDDEDKSTKGSVKSPAKPAKSNGTTAAMSSEREIVLRETYTITEIPDAILSMISQQLDDAEKLGGDEYKLLHSASPAIGLRALSGLVFAMFRATAPSFYETAMPSGNMHMYNDCLYLAETFRTRVADMAIPGKENDILAIEKFAKSAYAREMDTQRTVLHDLLDGAQGFAGCTEYPLSAECDTAVSSTVDRISIVYDEWKTILSHSALLQSVGSLLSTVIDKVVRDIEDMEDISEAESKRLTGYCEQISKLDKLFMRETQEAGEEAVSMTAVYVSNWLRFQYLTNILESSLADIKYMWTEGEMSLEFSADEVIDLIKALFADSHYRRNAINEMKRSTRS